MIRTRGQGGREPKKYLFTGHSGIGYHSTNQIEVKNKIAYSNTHWWRNSFFFPLNMFQFQYSTSQNKTARTLNRLSTDSWSCQKKVAQQTLILVKDYSILVTLPTFRPGWEIRREFNYYKFYLFEKYE